MPNVELITRQKPSRAPRRVQVDHVPEPKLAAAIRDMRAGRYVEYDSVEAIRADVEAHKRKLSRR